MPIPYRDVIALRALDAARRAVEVSEDHIVAKQHEVSNPAWDQVCQSFMTLATAHLGEDLARGLFECLLRSGDDVEECLAIVVGAPQVFVVVAGDGDRSYIVDRVCLSAERANSRTDDLLKTGTYDWVQVLPAELDVADGTGLDADPVKAARVAAWLEGVRGLTAPLPPGHSDGDPCPGGRHGPVPQPELTREDIVEMALRQVLSSTAVQELCKSEAFGALVFRVLEHAEAADILPVAVLRKVDSDTFAFLTRADDPASFLASRVARLPL